MNKVIIYGRLGQDPELIHTQNGTPIVNMSVATSDFYQKDGEKQQSTEWHRVIIFGKRAENTAKYLSKGSQCLVDGKLQTRKWTDKNQIDRYTTEIVCQNIQFGDRNTPGTSADSAGAAPNGTQGASIPDLEDIPL